MSSKPAWVSTARSRAIPSFNKKDKEQGAGTARVPKPVRRTGYFGYESAYPDHDDISKRESLAAMLRDHRKQPTYARTGSPAVMTIQHTVMQKLPGKGSLRCKFCTLMVSEEEYAEHLVSCSLAPVNCDLVDTETEEQCPEQLRGRQQLLEHQQRCSYRPVPCPNDYCTRPVSARSMHLHLQTCNCAETTCETCQQNIIRRDEEQHAAVCPEKLVRCPLLCGALVKRSALEEHIRTTMHAHTICLDRALPPDDPRSVYGFLLDEIKALTVKLPQHQLPPPPSALVNSARGTSTPRPGYTSTPRGGSIDPQYHTHHTGSHHPPVVPALGSVPNSNNKAPSASIEREELHADDHHSDVETINTTPPTSFAKPSYTELHDSVTQMLDEFMAIIQVVREKMQCDDGDFNAREERANVDAQHRALVEMTNEYYAAADRTVNGASQDVVDCVTRERDALQASVKFMDRAWYELRCAFYEKLFVKS